MNYRRMQAAIDFMLSVPSRAHFDMGTWCSHDSGDGLAEHGIKPGQALKPKDLHTCGTKACAAGWLATSPAWRRAGIKLVAEGDTTGANPNNFDRIQEYLDIGRGQFNELFADSTTINAVKTPKQWARFAERIMKRHKRYGY